MLLVFLLAALLALGSAQNADVDSEDNLSGVAENANNNPSQNAQRPRPDNLPPRPSQDGDQQNKRAPRQGGQQQNPLQPPSPGNQQRPSRPGGQQQNRPRPSSPGNQQRPSRQGRPQGGRQPNPNQGQ